MGITRDGARAVAVDVIGGPQFRLLDSVTDFREEVHPPGLTSMHGFNAIDEPIQVRRVAEATMAEPHPRERTLKATTLASHSTERAIAKSADLEIPFCFVSRDRVLPEDRFCFVSKPREEGRGPSPEFSSGLISRLYCTSRTIIGPRPRASSLTCPFGGLSRYGGLPQPLEY